MKSVEPGNTRRRTERAGEVEQVELRHADTRGAVRPGATAIAERRLLDARRITPVPAVSNLHQDQSPTLGIAIPSPNLALSRPAL
jgi:hypothetical protein